MDIKAKGGSPRRVTWVMVITWTNMYPRMYYSAKTDSVSSSSDAVSGEVAKTSM